MIASRSRTQTLDQLLYQDHCSGQYYNVSGFQGWRLLQFLYTTEKCYKVATAISLKILSSFTCECWSKN